MAKKMTAKEKAERAKIKKELQADGIIPLDKKPLNRKKFIEEATAEFAQAYDDSVYDVLLYLLEAVQVMMAHIKSEKNMNTSRTLLTYKGECLWKNQRKFRKMVQSRFRKI